MPDPWPKPEIPYPFPPTREPPTRLQPPIVPSVNTLTQLTEQLAEQRRIMCHGSLTADAVTDVVAQLMAFDGASSRNVEIIISSPGGPVSAILPVLDVFALMRARVDVTAIGSVSGTAVALVAACSGERRAAAHATLSLRVDATQSIEGTAADIVRHVDELAKLRSRYLAVLSSVTGLDEGVLAQETDHGALHSPDEAIALGIIDTIAGQS